MAEAAEALGRHRRLPLHPGHQPARALADTDAAAWRRIFDTNVIGAALVTAAALPHLEASEGRALYLSSVSASLTPPWPGLGAYVVSKAALDKLIEAWRGEHPEVALHPGRRRRVRRRRGRRPVADDHRVGTSSSPPRSRPPGSSAGYMSGALIDIEHLIDAIDSLLATGPSLRMPTVVITSHPIATEPLPTCRRERDRYRPDRALSMEHIGSLLLGLGNGAVFAAIAVALVVTYRSSGVINFATGAIALYVAYTYASLRKGELLVLIPGLPQSIDLGQPLGFWPAAAISLVVAALLGRAPLPPRVPSAARGTGAGARASPRSACWS